MNNRYITNKNLLIKYFPKVSWQCVGETNKEGEPTGNFTYKGTYENFSFDFYAKTDWETLTIWFNGHHLLLSSTEKNTTSTIKLMIEGVNALQDIYSSIGTLLDKTYG